MHYAMYTAYCMLYAIHYLYFYSVKFPLFYIFFSCRGPNTVKTADAAEQEEEVHNFPLKCNVQP